MLRALHNSDKKSVNISGKNISFGTKKDKN
jgi:hypothetical protein